MAFPRESGILLHPTSFPSRYGIGDLGSEAYRFVEFLADTGQRIWQILPLGPTGYGDSPYLAFSAMAGNPLLICPDRLRSDGLLTDADLADIPEFPQRVDYGWVMQVKMPLLRKACEAFQAQADPEYHKEFEQFCQEKADWLEDYALFRAISDAHNGENWNTWDASIAKREPAAMEEWRQKLASEVFYQKFIQFQFFRQWKTLKNYANEKGIQILGDLPIYVAFNSSDVWANPHLFCLDEETNQAKLVAGVPPDYFSATGQLWGNPIYNWEQMQQEDFRWWIQRFKVLLEYVDLLRIDHFRAFQAYWAVPGTETTAINGEWIEAPGREFFLRLRQELGSLPIVAEDLGLITPEVEELRDEFEFPGMKILHFAFDSDTNNPYLPFNYQRNCIAYTGTHDNDTTVGWFNKRSHEEQQRVIQYMGCTSSEGIHWDLIRLAFASVANQAIIPLQDLLGLDSDGRMNSPSQQEGNWNWRYWYGALNQEVRDRLRSLTERYGRLPKPWNE